MLSHRFSPWLPIVVFVNCNLWGHWSFEIEDFRLCFFLLCRTSWVLLVGAFSCVISNKTSIQWQPKKSFKVKLSGQDLLEHPIPHFPLLLEILMCFFCLHSCHAKSTPILYRKKVWGRGKILAVVWYSLIWRRKQGASVSMVVFHRIVKLLSPCFFLAIKGKVEYSAFRTLQSIPKVYHEISWPDFSVYSPT